jgi:hypothetical protein
MSGAALRRLVATGAILAPALHSFTDLLEIAAGFTPPQLLLNYLAFLALPFVVIGLHAVQQGAAGALGLAGALAYAASFVYFAGTTIYALARHTPDYATLLAELGWPYTAHGALMIAGGALFGVAVIRARVLPAWTGVTLIAGVALNLVVALSALPPILQAGGTLLRNIALIGMGVALLGRSAAANPPSPP